MILRTTSSRRRATALVETAAIVSVFLLMLFGVMEYCRYMFMRQLVANAAREGARYAVTHTQNDTVTADAKAQVVRFMGGLDGKVKNFTVQIYRGDASGNKIFSYDSSGEDSFAYQTNATGNYLEGSDGTKYYVGKDATGNYVNNGASKVYVKLDANTQSVSGVSPAAFSSFAGASGKKIKGLETADTAAFGQYIVVEITCDYNPILPSFLHTNSTLRLTSKCTMYSEAN